MPQFLLDTDVLIDASRNFPGAKRYLEQSVGAYISTISAMELIMGTKNAKEATKVEKFLLTLTNIPLIPKTSTIAYELLKKHAHSDGLELADALIAATALTFSLTLVTRNVKHFKKIRNLKIVKPPYC